MNVSLSFRFQLVFGKLPRQLTGVKQKHGRIIKFRHQKCTTLSTFFRFQTALVKTVQYVMH